MKFSLKQLFAVWFSSLFLLGIFVWIEQQYQSNTRQQIDEANKQVQQTITDKELECLQLFRSISSDTIQFQRDWSSINSQLRKQNLGLCIYKNDSLRLWTSNQLVGDDSKQLKVGTQIVKYANGYYLVYKNVSGSFGYVFTYGIKTEYAFKNQYIENHFAQELGFIEEGFLITRPVDGFYDIKSLGQDYLFSIQIYASHLHTPWWIITIIIFCLGVNCMFLHLLARHYIVYHFWMFSALFFAFFITIRGLALYFHVPHFLYEMKLFDVSIYASSYWFRSLGDLAIDSFLMLWYVVILEIRYNYFQWRRKNEAVPVYKVLFLFVLSFMVVFLVNESVRSITIDSQISFDINYFDTINTFTYLGIIICIVQILIVYFLIRGFVRAFKAVNPNHQNLLAILVLILCAATALYLLAIQGYNSFIVMMSYVMYVVFFVFKYFEIRSNRFQQYFAVIFIISFFLSVNINHWLHFKERENRKLQAGKLISQNDITTDYFLSTIEKKLVKDEYILNYFKNPIILKSQFERRIRQLYFTGYLSKFEVSVLDYDSMGFDFKQRNEYGYRKMNVVYNSNSIETINRYFRYVKSGNLIKGYLARFEIKDKGQKQGYLFLLLQPKLIQDENRFDALLIEGFRQPRKSMYDYSYAVYKDKNLVFQNGNFPYRITNTWGQSVDTFRFFNDEKYEHLLYTDSQPLTIVVSRPTETFLQVIGLFSFVFTFCTVMLILILFAYLGINSHFLNRYAFFNNRFTHKIRSIFNRLLLVENPDILFIRTRIQSSIIFIVFISLSITAYFTISFITTKYNSRQTDRLMKKLRNVVITIENENLRTLSTSPGDELEAYINQIADFYDTDISLFNAEGKVIASSISRIYDEGIISSEMDPDAFFHLSLLKESQFSQAEHISELQFQAAYAPVFLNKTEVVGYLQLPYFNQQVDLQAEISSVIVGFINLYVLLFIIIGIIAYLVSRNISAPLTLIQEKLAKTTLSNKNEPISWHRDDEIGDLVKQYNSMIDKLEDSARKIAESEREGAWREIARQIAHEIKNPLTPMKLSVQHLQRAYKNNDAKLSEKIERTTQLLITQIDTLSELASEFSSFAKMPTPVYENIDVKAALQQVIDLYSVDATSEIVFRCPDGLSISFDRNYFTRSIGNVLKNALQAIPEDRKGRIEITVEQHPNHVSITIADNGTGMNAQQASKIFMPYFSTKVTGMGLGLPIVKNMIESGNGTIHFTTKEQEGTTFIITLPL